MEALTLEGHDVTYAPDAAAALLSLRAGGFEVAILDIDLPGMSGWDLAKVIRANDDWTFARLIALTARHSVEDRERSKQVGFDEHLTKPVGLNRLLKALVVY